MNKTNHYRLLTLLGLTCFAIDARQIQLPPVIIGMQPGYIHYKEPRPKDDENCWNYDVWNSAFGTLADRGHTNKDNRKTESLAGIWFGQDSFTLLQAFAPGSYSPLFPMLGVFQVTPRFNFSEQGANFGMNIERGLCCGKYRVGIRATLPVRHLRVQLDDCCDLAENIDDVLVRRHEVVQSNENKTPSEQSGGFQIIPDSFAYRMDFLANLPYPDNTPFNDILIFKDSISANHITMNKVDMTQTINDLGALVHVGQPVHVVMKNGVPNLPFSLINEPGNGAASPSESALPILAGDGLSAFAVSAGDAPVPSGNERARFDASQDYSALGSNPGQQRQLWVVPTDINQASTAPEFVTLKSQEATQLQVAVERAVRGIDKTISGFLNATGLTFDTQEMSGLGDLDVALYFSRQACWWYAEIWGGALCPTGRKIKDPKQLLLLQSTGNNKHWEGRVGLTFGMEPTDWFNFVVGGYYSYAFKHTENVAASFKGATVKNIGPMTQANVSWGYFAGNVDLTFRVPCNPFIGFTYGYSPYVKQQDKVKFKLTEMPDFFGVTQPLDPSVIEMRTKQVAHSFRAEAFLQSCYGEVYAGFSRVFAGKNSMHESTYYLGMTAYF